MSLSCLTCQPSPSHSPYYPPSSHSPNCRCSCCPTLDRSWSGGITPPPYAYFGRSHSTKGRVEFNPKKGNTNNGAEGHHRKMNSTGSPYRDVNGASAEPRLVRSGGMRRDWSFENLKARANVPRSK